MPRHIAVGADGRLVLEYVRNRRLVRLSDRLDKARTIELPIQALIDEMGDAAAELVPSRHYLLFAGSHDRPVGGPGDLVGAYASEARARDAFHCRRAKSVSTAEWAEVLAVDAASNLKRICWFGTPPRRHSQPEPAAVESAPRQRRFLPRRK